MVNGGMIGPYTIITKLGEGGMGEVYRARDTKLNRDVAIKVLPEAFTLDADRLARFTREAQLLASLNHPNIAAIYGIEGTALVMELVEGEDLSQRIARGAIPLDEALPIAKQIADALEAAHEQGIIHRDLKPANIKVREDGTVKVLDFGLAKALDQDLKTSRPQDLANSPTITTPAMTMRGMILGTAAYMSPEQARGKAVDRRADIWAFGVVLFEMLSGTRVFAGNDISITLANVLKEDVRWGLLPADLPGSVPRLLRRCLEKDPKRRLSAIGDARFELDDATLPSDGTRARAARSGLGRERFLWAAVVVLVAAASIALALRFVPAPPTPPLVRFGILPPGEGRFTGTAPRLAVSPDGKAVVFAGTSQPGKPSQLWLRRLDSMQVTPILGTESTAGAIEPQSPFWSPDGKRLAFFVQLGSSNSNSQLRTLDLGTGAVRTVCDLPSNNAGGTWNADGVLLVSSQETKGVQRLSINNSVPTPVTTLDSSHNETAHLFPQFLPDGRRFLYQVQTLARSDWTTVLGSLDSTVRTPLVQSEYARFVSPNILLYSKAGNLVAQVMDLNTWALVGEPVLIATGVPTVATNGRAGFAVSDSGVLVYSSEPEQRSSDSRLAWVDRRGTELEGVGLPFNGSRIRLSPDGARVALLETIPGRIMNEALWLADLRREIKTPLGPGQSALSPAWSADGSRLLFGSLADKGDIAIVERASNGATPARSLLAEPGMSMVPLDESNDGSRLLFSSAKSVGSAGLHRLMILSKADGRVTEYLPADADRPHASLSSDGKWLAYASNESGTHQIIIQPFPNPSTGKWQVSTAGGVAPRWRRDGRELFYVDSLQRVVAVSVTANQGVALGAPTPLFRLPYVSQVQVSGGAYVYDVAPDGQRFLVSLAPGAANSQGIPLTVTMNWTSLLKQ